MEQKSTTTSTGKTATRGFSPLECIEARPPSKAPPPSSFPNAMRCLLPPSSSSSSPLNPPPPPFFLSPPLHGRCLPRRAQRE
jgi:hypothetical protein